MAVIGYHWQGVGNVGGSIPPYGFFKEREKMAKSFRQRLADLDKQHKADLANKEKDRAAAHAKVNAELTDTQRQAYIGRMQQQKDIPNQLRQMGISGGGSETTLLGAETNYQNRRALNEKSAMARRSEIDRSADEDLRILKSTHTDRRLALQQQADQEELDTYKGTLARFGSLDQINEEIRRLRKIGRYDLIPYAQLQKQAILDKQKSAMAKSSGSGGSSGGSTSRSSTVANMQKAAEANKGNSRRSKPRRSKPRRSKPKTFWEKFVANMSKPSRSNISRPKRFYGR